MNQVVSQGNDRIPLDARSGTAQIGRNLAQCLTDDGKRIEGRVLRLRRLRQNVGGKTGRMVERLICEIARIAQTVQVGSAHRGSRARGSSAASFPFNPLTSTIP